jgi:hypothetical protein
LIRGDDEINLSPYSLYAQQEAAERPRKATRERIAKALDIPAPLLNL